MMIIWLALGIFTILAAAYAAGHRVGELKGRRDAMKKRDDALGRMQARHSALDNNNIYLTRKD